jgi:membrane fusion protein, multidrug efflux system
MSAPVHLGFAIAISAIALFSSCSQKPSPPAAQIARIPVAHPVERDIVDWDQYTGRLAAIDEVQVRARVSGYLNDTRFTDGQMVKAGDLLFEIDPRPFQAQVDGAQAQLRESQARLQLAITNLDRSSALFQQKAISKEEFETRKSDKLQAEGAVEAARAALESASLQLEWTQVRAPISGRLSRVLVTKGNLISGGTDQSTFLTTIVSLDPIYCYFDLDENSYLKYLRLSSASGQQKSDEVGIALADEQQYPHKGKLDFVDNQIDRATGTMRERAVLANPDLSLTPGAFARVRITGNPKHKALLVPDEAIAADQSQQIVYVVDNQQKVQYRQVKTGQVVDGLRVITDGITPSDRVIVSGLQQIRPGQAIIPVENATTEASAARQDEHKAVE